MRLRYETRSGRTALFQVKQADGTALCRISHEMPVREKGAKADGHEWIHVDCDGAERFAGAQANAEP